jgi:hypothetical protein
MVFGIFYAARYLFALNLYLSINQLRKFAAGSGGRDLGRPGLAPLTCRAFAARRTVYEASRNHSTNRRPAVGV